MDIPEKATYLVKQWSEAIDLEGLSFDDDGIIEFEFGEELRASLGIDDTGEAMVLCAEVWPSAASLSGTLLRRMLITNGTQFSQHGPTFAVPTTSDTVVLQQRIPLESTTYPEFEKTLLDFSDAFEKTREKLTALAPSTAESSPAPEREGEDDSGLVFVRL